MINAIDEAVQGRDIEKAWDRFIESVTDSVIDRLMIPEDDAIEAIDYIVERVMLTFNYQLKH